MPGEIWLEMCPLVLVLGDYNFINNWEKNVWDSVQLNHPYGTFSNFPEQAKEK